MVLLAAAHAALVGYLHHQEIKSVLQIFVAVMLELVLQQAPQQPLHHQENAVMEL